MARRRPGIAPCTPRVTLTREMEVNAPGVALALDLMDEIEALKAALRRV